MDSQPGTFAVFRFFGNVTDFLAEDLRERSIVHRFRGTPSVKDRIETLGPPHTEVAHIRVDGDFTDYRRRLTGGEYVEVYAADVAPPIIPGTPPLNARPEGDPCFVADVNLGRLAKLMRLIGFDTLYRNNYDDAHVAAVSIKDARILLTRDRRLLMRRDVQYGYFVRNDNPHRQVKEVLHRFDLRGLTRPFHRCSRCNGLVRPVTKADVLPLLEPRTRLYYHSFWQCPDCGQVYWEGSHMTGLNRLVDRLARPVQGSESNRRRTRKM